MNWNHTAIPIREARHYYTLDILPTSDAPFGEKGKALAAAWRQLSTTDMAGMLILDGDVAVDPHDRLVMLDAIHHAPKSVHVAPAKIWPISTKRDDWVWAHWQDDATQVLEWSPKPKWFTLCFTYLPRRLITGAMLHGLPTWRYPGVDTNFCRLAQRLDIDINVVTGCSPKHLNY
jgi:hypothetical protein